MKPATIGLFAFLVSLLVYTITGFILESATNTTGSNTFLVQEVVVLAVVAAIITGALAFGLERSTEQTEHPI